MWVRFPSEGEKERGREVSKEGGKEGKREGNSEGGREGARTHISGVCEAIVAPGSALGKLPPTPLDPVRSCFMSFQVPQRHLN